MTLAETSGREGTRRAVAGQRSYVHVGGTSANRIALIGDVAAVRRNHRLVQTDRHVLDQRLGGTAQIGRLPVDRRGGAPREIQYALAVRRPFRPLVGVALRRQAGRRLRLEIVEPDVRAA